jgi:23S rRNA (cytidine1920-2'-O)/16S rRNA (cytidine1409-2'-O)-methyltransferase
LLRAGGVVVALIKPQFEVGREAVGKRGVVRDRTARSTAIARTVEEAVALGFEAMAQADCVIAGPQGNLEHFVWLTKP